MSSLLEQCLADLDRRIIPAQEDAHMQAWVQFLEGKLEQGVFSSPARKPSPPGVEWPQVTINQALDDVDAMLIQQFGACSKLLSQGGSEVLNVRCNYGTCIVPSIFGCELFVMEEALNTLPTNRPRGIEGVKAILESGVPDVRGGLGGEVFRAAEKFLDVMGRYPNIGRYIRFYHPDAQGPLDLAEVIWGSDIFYAFHDEQQILRDFLNLITETYIVFMREWYKLVGAPGKYSAHWGFLHKGVLALRNDSLMNLSPQAYVEFGRPLDQRLFDEFGGGVIHFCGRGDHFIDEMAQMRGLYGINISQPELNDMEKVFRHTIDKGVPLLEMRRDYISTLIATGRPLRGMVHVES